MKLPLTQAELEWSEKIKSQNRSKVEAKRGPMGKQCRDCHHGVAHQFTDKLFYCMKTRDKKGNPGKTQRTWTCEQFTERKPS